MERRGPTPREMMAFQCQSELGGLRGFLLYLPVWPAFREITGEQVALCCLQRAERMHISRSVASPSLISRADLSTPRQPSLPTGLFPRSGPDAINSSSSESCLCLSYLQCQQHLDCSFGKPLSICSGKSMALDVVLCKISSQ